MSEIVSTIPLALTAAILLCFYEFILQPAYFSPLSGVPNAHWSAPFSSFWIRYIQFSSQENRTVLAAHNLHGPIVRLGPKEISVNSVDGGIRTVYGAGYEKGQWYAIFDNYGVPCMFSTLLSNAHAQRKRMISNVYSKSTIQSSVALHAQSKKILYDRLLPLLSSYAEKDSVFDALEIWNASTMDFITAYQFGLSSASNFLQEDTYRKHWLDLYQSRKKYTFFPQELPRLTAFMHRIPFIRLYPRWVDSANAEIQAWVAKLCDSSRATIGTSSDPEDEAVVLNAVLAGYEKEERVKGPESILADSVLKERNLSIYSEMLDHCAAGHETSGITMTYASWHLSRNMDLQDALRAELKTLGNPIVIGSGEIEEAMTIPDSKQLDSLPILHAVLMETLRLDASIPGSQPRVSPITDSTLCGYRIPGGTRVSASAYSLHRVESAYADPDRWDHTRWLNEEHLDDEARKQRDRHFWAFSSGGKMCIGSNFAIHELKLMIAAVYSNFRTYIVDDTGIEQADGYTCGPISNRLMLRLERVDS